MNFLKRLFRSRIKEVNVTFIGLDNAGKTTIVKYLETGSFVETYPTMGINRGATISLSKMEINVFDIGGQEDFRNLWADINEKSDGIVFVVDSSDYVRFEETRRVFHEVINTQLFGDVVVLILLHKCDLQDRMERSRFISEFNLINLPFKWAIYETSAKTGENIIDSFSWFFKSILEVVS